MALVVMVGRGSGVDVACGVGVSSNWDSGCGFVAVGEGVVDGRLASRTGAWVSDGKGVPVAACPQAARKANVRRAGRVRLLMV
jgi:hypothetical protein